MKHTFYKGGYKYQITEGYSVKITIKSVEDIGNDYLKLSSDGILSLKKGYAWDGPSGPTLDTLNFMRGSLVHDALYQLMREKLLDKDTYRKQADQLLKTMCKEDGMWSIRAWWVYTGVRIGGDKAASPSNQKPVLKAPKNNFTKSIPSF